MHTKYISFINVDSGTFRMNWPNAISSSQTMANGWHDRHVRSKFLLNWCRFGQIKIKWIMLSESISNMHVIVGITWFRFNLDFMFSERNMRESKFKWKRNRRSYVDGEREREWTKYWNTRKPTRMCEWCVYVCFGLDYTWVLSSAHIGLSGKCISMLQMSCLLPDSPLNLLSCSTEIVICALCIATTIIYNESIQTEQPPFVCCSLSQTHIRRRCRRQRLEVNNIRIIFKCILSVSFCNVIVLKCGRTNTIVCDERKQNRQHTSCTSSNILWTTGNICTELIKRRIWI